MGFSGGMNSHAYANHLCPQKKTALLFGDGHSQFFHHRQHVLPHLALLAHRLVAQQIGRMIRRHQGRAAVGLPGAAQLRDAEGLAEQPVHRRGAQGHDDAGPDQINLLVQVGNAGGHLVGGRLAVAGGLAERIGPALQDVADIDVRPLQAHGLDDFGEQLAGLADKRFALFVFVRARRLANEHERGVNAADAKDNRFARRREARAFDARERPFPQRGKRGGFLFRIERRGPGGNRFAGQGEQGGLCGNRCGRGRRHGRPCGGRDGGGFGDLGFPRLSQGAQGFRRDGDVLDAARFQVFQMLDGRVEQLVIGIGHGVSC